MKEKSITITGLPKGVSAAIGNYVRTLYLAAASKYCIIGVSVNNLGFFERLGANTAMANDLLLMIAESEYLVKDEVLTDIHKLGNTELGDVYSITTTGHFENRISLSAFDKVFTVAKEKEIQLTEPVDLTVTFYICNIQGIVRENLITAALQDLSGQAESSHILYIPCRGRHVSDFWHTYKEHKFTEDLTLHIRGPEDQISSDLAHLVGLHIEYITKLNDGLQQFLTASSD